MPRVNERLAIRPNLACDQAQWLVPATAVKSFELVWQDPKSSDCQPTARLMTCLHEV